MVKLSERHLTTQHAKPNGLAKLIKGLLAATMLLFMLLLSSCSQSFTVVREDEELVSQRSGSPFDGRVFNWQHYLSVNPDLRAAGLATEAQARQHWSSCGFYEGREASIGFNSVAYLNRYPDLQRAYDVGVQGGLKCGPSGGRGIRYLLAIEHYLRTFATESRIGGRVDLFSSQVFDANYYLATYTDLRAAGLTTAQQAKEHWLVAGIYEGRRGSANFSAQIYLNRYADLRQAFQGYSRYANALTHYLQVGIAEGRSGR